MIERAAEQIPREEQEGSDDPNRAHVQKQTYDFHVDLRADRASAVKETTAIELSGINTAASQGRIRPASLPFLLILRLPRLLMQVLGSFITHDLNLVRRFADRIAVMEDGRIVETGPVAQVFDKPQHAYTRKLIDSRPARDVAEGQADPAAAAFGARRRRCLGRGKGQAHCHRRAADRAEEPPPAAPRFR